MRNGGSISAPSGANFSFVDFYCRLFAKLIEDVEDYTQDVCFAHMVRRYRLEYNDDAVKKRIFQTLEDTNHPILFDVRVLQAFERKSSEDRRMLLDWFSSEENYDYNQAHRFNRIFSMDDESRAIFKAMDDRLQAYADDMLPHNPYGPSILRIIRRHYPLIVFSGRIPYRQSSDKWATQRLTVSKPFDPQVWMDAGRAIGRSIYAGEAGRQLPYFENAIYYSMNDQKTLQDVQTSILGVYRRYHFILDLGDETPKPLMSQTEMDDTILCPATRLNRIIEAICEWEGKTVEDCAHPKEWPEYFDVIEEVEQRDICRQERYGEIETLIYSPVEVVVTEKGPIMANR